MMHFISRRFPGSNALGRSFLFPRLFASPTSVVAIVLCYSSVALAEPTPAATANFNAYISTVESRLAQQHQSANGFLASVDPDRLRNGELVIEKLAPASSAGFPGAMLPPCLIFLDRDGPADPLIARKWSYVFPGRQCLRVRLEGLSEISRKIMYNSSANSNGCHSVIPQVRGSYIRYVGTTRIPELSAAICRSQVITSE